MSATVHLAPVVVTMTGPFLRDAAVAVEAGAVVEVGPRSEVVRRHARARLREHAGVLTPGLVNAHAHLEHAPPVDDLAVAARGSVHALLRSGTTAAADVVLTGSPQRAAERAGLAGTAFVAGDGRRPPALASPCPLAPDRVPLASPGDPVVLCTRSDTARRAGEAPVAAYLTEGAPVALGTDSLASCPDLDLLAEARATRDLALSQGAEPDGLAERLVRAATVGGAAVMGLRGTGTLAPGVRADLAVFDVPTDGDPFQALVEHGAGRCTTTAVAGRLVHRR